MTRNDDAAVGDRGPRAAARLLAAAVGSADPGAAFASRVGAALGVELAPASVARCVESLSANTASGAWRDVPAPLFDATVAAAVALGRAEWLGSALAADLGAKDRTKAVKRALHGLRARGVTVAEPASPSAPSAFRARAVHDPDAERRSVVSAPDGMGARLVVVIADLDGGVAFVEAIFRDATLVRVAGTVSPRKVVRPMVRQLFDTWGEALTSVDVSIGAGEILDADAAGRLETASVRDRLAELRPVLRPLAADRKRLAEPVLDPDRVRRRAAESAALLDSPIFAGWMPDQRALLECGESVHRAMASDLVLNEAQRHEQVEGVFTRAVRDYLTEPHRRALADRLRHAGRFLLAAGRGEDAERAWAAAATLDEGGTPSFADRMFRRFFDSPAPPAVGEAPSTEPPSEPRSRLVLPGTVDAGGAKRGGGLILP